MSRTVEQADIAARSRATYAPFAGVALLSVQQWLFFSREWNDVGALQLGAWLVLAILALLFLMTGGMWFRSAQVRALANDETTERSRQVAIKAGFLSALVTALIVFAVSPFEPLSAQRAAHIICSLGLGIALVVFGIEERRHLG
ncbi:hypothetical protein [Sphingomonas japonica]|uniref:Uncharacterized PurR-regulated membrane protein YhhQ (DUF165 family) n=1 Tax=Sphingomonas japonica TaxID=511662 RepID=A0ABX0U527_9SPHN|nr:hypothetical protein [Sphingomonas japonica]NIJ23883.1 uncharacterized PurR-regulated membrane protein YhhQ (DUF165 family) [Sphingomonas japonica]